MINPNNFWNIFDRPSPFSEEIGEKNHKEGKMIKYNNFAMHFGLFDRYGFFEDLPPDLYKPDDKIEDDKEEKNDNH